MVCFAGPLPSVFRGVVVVDSSLGVRVLSVEDSSQAFLADLRSGDVIVRINDAPIRTIDEFAVQSQTLKGRATKATVVVLRNGQPHQLLLHLYSYPILRHWDLVFVPDHDIRFAEPKAGREYWMRMARGFETAGDQEHMLNACLNALHNDPTQVDIAAKAADVLWRIAQHRLDAHDLSGALTALQQGTLLLNRLFDHPLDPEQLQAIKGNLEHTLAMIQRYRAANTPQQQPLEK